MKKKNMIILIVLLAIGFAAVSTTLIINGNIGVQTNTDDFKIGVVFDEASIRTSNNDITAEISESGRTLSFTTHTMTNVNDTSTVYFKIKNYTQYDAILGRPAISCYFVDGHQVDEKATQIGTTHEYVELIPGHELDGDKILGGGVELSEESNVTVKQIKSYTGDASEVKFQCEINADASDSDTPAVEKPVILLDLPEGVTLTNDKNEDGIADVGDKIQVGTESFYVISHTKNQINALAENNLKVGNIYTSDDTKESTIQPTEEGYGKQDKDMKGYVSSGEKRYGTIKFSKAKGWATGVEPIEIRKEAYRVGNSVTSGTMTTLDALYTSNGTFTGYEDYIKGQVPDSKRDKISVRLIRKSEVDTLKSVSGYRSWLYSTTYWTESAYSYNSNSVWCVNSDGNMSGGGFDNVDIRGVRPVITISK